MKIALVYDYLNQFGGGERVLQTLLLMFPRAPLYTLFHDEKKTNGCFRGRVTATSFLDWPLVRRYHRAFIPLMPRAAQSINLRNYFNLIISVGAGYAKGITHSPATKHLHYCLSPLRYAWERSYLDSYSNVFKNMGILLSPIIAYLKNWDYEMAQKPDWILADSQFIAGKIRNYYGREAAVIYPPVDLKKFYFDPGIQKKDYFLAVGRLLHYKKFDLIVRAFNQLSLPLLIAGQGPEEKRLKQLAASSRIQFLGAVSDEILRRLYQEAQAIIFPQTEDFGLTAVEAQACGTPVIAFRAGGALETVKDGETGLFFEEPTAESLTAAVFELGQRRFEPRSISQAAAPFSLDNFKEKFYNQIRYV